jgi:predicted protein tyrosine phosphatase
VTFWDFADKHPHITTLVLFCLIGGLLPVAIAFFTAPHG